MIRTFHGVIIWSRHKTLTLQEFSVFSALMCSQTQHTKKYMFGSETRKQRLINSKSASPSFGRTPADVGFSYCFHWLNKICI